MLFATAGVFGTASVRSAAARRWIATRRLSVPTRLKRISPSSTRSVQIAPLRCAIGPDLPILG